MSLRKRTEKAKKFGTPTTPTTPTTPKPPSPKQAKIVQRPSTSAIVTSGQPKEQRPSPRTQQIQIWSGGELRNIGFQTTPSEIESNIQQKFRDLTSGFASTLGLDFNAMSASVKQIQSLLTQKKEAEYFRNKNTVYDEEQIIKDIDKKIEEIEIKEIETQLTSNVNQIIEALESGKLLYPEWFKNNIAWVKTGHITSQEFLDTYYYLSNQGTIHTSLEPIIEEPIIEEPIIEEPLIELPELLPEVIAESQINDSINTNMITQQVINFNIINGRAVGSIKFVATNNFNPYYYNKNIINIVQFKDPNGANILTTVKQNTLNFTETERDEVINYDEDMQGNTRATVESFVWEWIDKPAGAFSNKYTIEISEKEPPKPLTTGFMGAGIAGAIAGLILIGFIADYKRGK
jgi:hypothetical protein